MVKSKVEVPPGPAHSVTLNALAVGPGPTFTVISTSDVDNDSGQPVPLKIPELSKVALSTTEAVPCSKPNTSIVPFTMSIEVGSGTITGGIPTVALTKPHSDPIQVVIGTEMVAVCPTQISAI